MEKEFSPALRVEREAHPPGGRRTERRNHLRRVFYMRQAFLSLVLDGASGRENKTKYGVRFVRDTLVIY